MATLQRVSDSKELHVLLLVDKPDTLQTANVHLWGGQRHSECGAGSLCLCPCKTLTCIPEELCPVSHIHILGSSNSMKKCSEMMKEASDYILKNDIATVEAFHCKPILKMRYALENKER